MQFMVGDIPRFAFGFANPNHAAIEYDRRGRLLAVKDADGNAVERYVYDKAGNMTKKVVRVRSAEGCAIYTVTTFLAGCLCLGGAAAEIDTKIEGTARWVEHIDNTDKITYGGKFRKEYLE